VEAEAVDGETLRMSVESLAQLVRERGPAVVLTGAGISTESGIPDFRSPTGLWAQYDPQEYATIDAFRADPVKVWSFYALRYSALTTAQPNAGHLALAELERQGFVRAVVTQNIDCLHERAGSRDVVEVHGSIRTCSCPSCGQKYLLPEVVALLEEGGDAPRCEDDGTVLKPDVVFFGETVPAERVRECFDLVEGARLLLVLGSSLTVMSGRRFVLRAAKLGIPVAIVNQGPTRGDDYATLTVDAPLGTVLPELVRLVDARV
jgi:NAD-dependent SIR2 family protein deacetylase